MNDERLSPIIERLKKDAHSADAWDDLYRAIYPYVFATMFRAVRGNNYLAEEAVQEVVMRLVQNVNFKMDGFDAGSLRAYVSRTSRSVLVDLLRKEERQTRNRVSLDELGEQALDIQDGGSGLFDEGLLGSRILEAASGLSPREKIVVEYLLEGRNVNEIARSLSVTEKTAYNLISLVRGQMRDRLFAS